MNYNFIKINENIKNNAYKLIGSGSSRKVYDLENGYVVKAAKDVRGISQNRTEHIVYQSHQSDFFAEVTAISDDYRYLIMPRAERIKSLNPVINYFKVNNFKSLLKINNLQEDIKNNDLSKDDIKRVSSWGIINGIPFIIDYGLTKKIFMKYYRMSFFKKFKKL